MAAPGAENDETVQQVVEVGGRTFLVVDHLGDGYSGTVLKAYNQERNKKFALKVMYKDEKTWNPRSSPDRLRREIVCLKGLSHPNIVKLYGYDMDCVIENRECVVLLFEVLSKGELFDYISPSEIFTHGQVRYMIKEILGGLKAVHDQGFAHRDIKLQNIMLNKNYGVKLIDFGFLQKFKNPETGAQQRMRSTLGTKCYVAPEVSSGNYTEKCDIFSSGVVAFILLASAPPFGEHGDWWHTQIMRENWGRFWSQHSRRPNVEYSDEFKEMIEGMLCPDPDNRWSVDQVLDCRYLEFETSTKEDFCKLMGQRRSGLKKVQQKALEQATQEGSGITITDGLVDALPKHENGAHRAVGGEEHCTPCCGVLVEGVNDCKVLAAKDLLTNQWRQKFEECKNDASSWTETMNEFAEEFPEQEMFKQITESLPEDNLQQLVESLATKTIQELEEVGAMFNLDVQQENDYNAVSQLMDCLSHTKSNMMWHPVFPRYVAKEEEFPLREFPEKMGVDTTNTFFTKLSFGLMCVVLDNFMDGKGELYVKAEQRTIVLNFAVPKTETFPGEDGEEDEEFETTVRFEVGVKMFKVTEDKQVEGRVHTKNQAVFENRTRNIMALEEYQWVVEQISTLPEVLGTWVDPDVIEVVINNQ